MFDRLRTLVNRYTRSKMPDVLILKRPGFRLIFGNVFPTVSDRADNLHLVVRWNPAALGVEFLLF
jgi:hypothetical protein